MAGFFSRPIRTVPADLAAGAAIVAQWPRAFAVRRAPRLPFDYYVERPVAWRDHAVRRWIACTASPPPPLSGRMKIAPNARGWVAVATSALMTVGCGPMAAPPRGQIEDSHADANYRYEAAAQAAHAGIPVDVRGAAAGLSDAALADAVVDAMPSRSLGLASRFQRGTGAAAERVVWVLGADGGRIEALCAGATSAAPQAPAARLAVSAAYCRGELVLTGVRATADDITSVADPAFGALIATLTGKLFPLQPGERVRGALTPPPNITIAVE
jgi:hypothetical protein